MAEGLDWIEDTTAEHIIIEAQLPDYLTLHDDQHHGYDAATHTLRTSLSDLRHKIDINLDALTFSGNGLEPKDGVLTLDFTPDIAAYIEAGTEAKLSTILHDEEIEFSAGIDATTLELVSLEGKIAYQYEETTTIEMGGIEEDIDLAINHPGLSPVITINVENPLTLDAQVSASLIPVIDGVEMGAASFPESSEARLNELLAAADAATTVAAADALDGSTYAGACIRLIQMLRVRHPETKIVFIIGDYVYYGMGEAARKIVDHFSDDYVRKVDILGEFGYKASGAIPKYDYAHPTAAGMDKIAKYVYEQVGAWIDSNN